MNDFAALEDGWYVHDPEAENGWRKVGSAQPGAVLFTNSISTVDVQRTTETTVSCGGADHAFVSYGRRGGKQTITDRLVQEAVDRGEVVDVWGPDGVRRLGNSV